jgi:DNA-binding NarL/FixJ family response regulator
MEDLHLKVLLVEDHGALREILLEFLNDLPVVASCEAFADAEMVLEALRASPHAPPPDLVLVDLSLPGMSGIELIRELRDLYPRLCCAILSGHRSPSYAGHALAAGAMGYILKGDPAEIERGIEAIFHGERFISRAVTEPQ